MIPQPLCVAGAGRGPVAGAGRGRGGLARCVGPGSVPRGRGGFAAESIVRVPHERAAPLAIEFKIGQEFCSGFAIDVIDQLKCLINIIFRRAVRGG